MLDNYKIWGEISNLSDEKKQTLSNNDNLPFGSASTIIKEVYPDHGKEDLMEVDPETGEVVPSKTRKWRVELSKQVMSTETAYIEVVAGSEEEAEDVALKLAEDWRTDISWSEDYNSDEDGDIEVVEVELI